MQVVVISQNQIESIPAMLDALKGHSVVYVLDRCKDGSERYQWPNNVQVVVNKRGRGFLAGKMRDLGALRLDNSKPILFLDGDKIPIGDINKLNAMPYDVVCLGVKNDRRLFFSSTQSHGQIPWQINRDFVNPHNGVYSCGIYLRPGAMIACKLVSKKDRIFNEDFDGYWGEEDRFVGDCVAHYGLDIGYTNEVGLHGALTSEEEANKKIDRNFVKRIKKRAILTFPKSYF